jgi:membrane-associated phospholipid phosphatase
MHSFDRRLGQLVRERVAAVPRLDRAARDVSVALAPAFTGLVFALLVHRRRAGIEAAAGALGAATAARTLRDAIGRPRPGSRDGGGFPSRHAAAAVAITQAIRRRHPVLGGAVGLAAAAGLVARIVDGQHDPADIIAGAALGVTCDRLVRSAGRVRG